MTKVRELFPDRPSLGHYLRIGGTGYQQLEELLEKGKLLIDRAVFDAGLLARQRDLLKGLGRAGAELVLDTNVAELSTPRYFDGALRQAPWAVAGRPLQLDDLRGARGLERIARIAAFAAEHDFNRVLSPTHLLRTGARDAAFRLDIETAEKLRSALDDEGRRDIAIDFPLILGPGILHRAGFIESLTSAIGDLPVESVWVRSSGFGSLATPIGIVRYTRAMRELLALNCPIIADGVAGLPALATLAFGAAAGVAHGIGVHESFKSSEWNKPRSSAGGGQPKRILINALDRQLKLEQIEAILEAKNGRRLIACNDRQCCPNGLKDMQSTPKAHYCYQRRQPITELSRVPYAHRGEYFIERVVGESIDRARSLDRLRIDDQSVKKLVSESRDRIERVYEVLEHFHADGDFSGHAPSLQRRNSAVTPHLKEQQ